AGRDVDVEGRGRLASEDHVTLEPAGLMASDAEQLDDPLERGPAGGVEIAGQVHGLELLVADRELAAERLDQRAQDRTLGRVVEDHATADARTQARQRVVDDPGEVLLEERALSRHRGSLRIRMRGRSRSEEHTSELQSRENLVCRLLLEKKNKKKT